MSPAFSLLELKVRRELMERSLTFYTALGFTFKTEKISDNPLHYVSVNDDFVFKLYPLTKDEGYPMPHARLGFAIDPKALTQLSEAEIEYWEKDYGYLTHDPMGRAVELKLKA